MAIGVRRKVPERLVEADKFLRKLIPDAEISKMSKYTRDAFVRVARLKSMARPRRGLKDKYFWALTDKEKKALIKAKRSRYMKMKKGWKDKQRPFEWRRAFNILTGEVITEKLRYFTSQKVKIQEKSESCPIGVPLLIHSRAVINPEKIDQIHLPFRFRNRLAIKAEKHGLTVAVRVLKDKKHSEAYIDIIRDKQTAQVTGFRVTEKDKKKKWTTAIQASEGLYSITRHKRHLIISSMYTNHYVHILSLALIWRH